CVLVAGGVQRLADHADLAVHHAGRTDHGGAGGGLDDRHLGVDVQRRVGVHRTGGCAHVAVTARGELVQAQVAHHHCGVAHLGDQIPDADVDDAVGVQPGRTGLVLARV